MSNDELAKTPLYPCHLQLGARLVPFAGYEMPVQYTGVLEEAKKVRKDCGLFDVSHMGQFSIRGKESLAEVQRLVTNDLGKLSIGQAQYNMLCDERGGVIDDLVVYRRSAEETYICVNASNRRTDFEWMRFRLNDTVTIEDQSDATSLLALQGPKAESLLSRYSPADKLRSLKFYWAVESKVFDFPCYLSRTGYTGEDGFEIYLKNEHAVKVWERLLEEGKRDGLVPAGLGARDTLRLEMGYPLHGHELKPSMSPLMANLGWVVKLNLPTAFVGQEALKKEAATGPKRSLKAFKILDRRLAREGYPICLQDGTVVGEISSGTHSPHLNAPIAMGFIDSPHAHLEKFFVKIREELVAAQVVKLPFVPAHTKK